MTKEEEEFNLSMAKRYRLNDLKVNEKDIDALRSNDEADELIAYLEKKNGEPDVEENKKKMVKLKANQGTAPLPEPKALHDEVKFNAEMFGQPNHPQRCINARWNEDARLMTIWDEHGNPRVF